MFVHVVDNDVFIHLTRRLRSHDTLDVEQSCTTGRGWPMPAVVFFCAFGLRTMDVVSTNEDMFLCSFIFPHSMQNGKH